MVHKFLFVSLMFVANIFCASAQAPQKQNGKPVVIPVVKFKPPVVKTFLGSNQNGATVTVDEANQLINLPLKIVDDKNITYTISSYQFMYKKKSVIENEQTGKKEIAFTTVAERFKTTPLPELWRKTISEGGLQKDEEFYFFDVIVNDKQNRKFFAPELKISIQ